MERAASIALTGGTIYVDPTVEQVRDGRVIFS